MLSARHSLARRFALYIICTLIVVNGCSLLYLYTIENKRNLRNLRDQGVVLGQYIGTSVSRHLLRYDFIALETVLEEAIYLQGVRYVAVLASNEVYVAAQATSLSGGWEQLSIVKNMREDTLDHIDISTPILFADKYLGRVVVGLSLENSRKETSAFLSVLLFVNGLVALSLGSGIYFFFWKNALQPIHKLIEGANRVAHGNFDKSIPVIRKDEIGLLTDSFNVMMIARKQAEEEMRKKRRDWERLFNAVEDVVTIQDNSMCILQANAAADKLLGNEPGDLVGKHCYDLFQKRTEPCPDCPVLLCQQDHAYHYADMQCFRSDKTFHVSAFPIFDEEEGWIGIAHIARDITNQKKLEAQYRQAQKMEAIGTLAGGIAHDFNNILTPIFGGAQLIKMDVEPGSKIDELLDTILKSSDLAKELVKQILTFSRERQHSMQELVLQPVIKESMKLLRSSIPSTIKFKVDLDENCGTVNADATQIHQVIMNLCTNAYHAMEQSGGILGVSLHQVVLDSVTALLKGNLVSGDYLELKVSDTGIGMDAVTRERIFEPFFTTKEEGKGTGMGLSVVHGLVKEYGGAISVYSEPGVGTTFTIYLPVSSSRKKSATPEYQVDENMVASVGNEHILVVDDEEDIVALEQRILERMGYRVTTSIDSRRALEVFQNDSHAFDLMITDMTMPGMTGLELIEQVLALRPDMPVILCSGHNRTTQKKLLKNSLVTSFLAKPINLRQLVEVVREELDKQ